MLKKSFSLIELLLALTLSALLLLSFIPFFKNLYEGFINHSATRFESIQLENTLLLLVNRLEHAIASTVSYTSAKELLWTAKAYEARLGYAQVTKSFITPAFVPVLDINTSTQTNFHSPALSTSMFTELITPLSYNNFSKEKLALYFHNTNSALVVRLENNNTITPLTTPSSITDIFSLSWSAYCISLEENKLYFYYNFQPWLAQTKEDGIKVLLHNNITSLSFSTKTLTLCNQYECKSKAF